MNNITTPVPHGATTAELAIPEQAGLPTAAAPIGVLLLNLGTPDTADVPGVRRYLKEFLSDPRVIEKQGLGWRMLLNGLILRIRPRIKARAYRTIWNMERNESPLRTITRAQAEKLGPALTPFAPEITIDWAMRYGNPSIGSRLCALIDRGCDRILIVPLYPQYSAATTATAGDEVFRVLMGMRRQPALRIAAPYYENEAYLDALVSSTQAAIAKLDFKPDVIIASFHGMPQDYVDKGDPYYGQCVMTTRLLRQRMGLDDSQLILTFQSRFGRGKWLEPATDRTVRNLARRGVKNLVVTTPGFSADCLETLEEIAIETAHLFRKHGGDNFHAIPCLNDSDAGMVMLRQLVLGELKGWVRS